MSTKRAFRLIGILAVLAMVLAACGGGADADAEAAPSEPAESSEEVAVTDEQHEEDEGSHEEDESSHEDGDDHDDEFTFGRPGEASEADRVVEVDANDDFTFSPAEIAVSAGETVTFVVTNTGAIPHDFTLGDQATQDAHEAEMAEMAASGDMGEHSDPNAVVLEAGETNELTWTFSEAGTVLIGCHQPGHYDAGMKGAVEVES